MNYQLWQKHQFVIDADFKSIEADYRQWTGLDTLRTGVVVAPYKIDFGPEETYKASSFIQYSWTPWYWSDFSIGLRDDYFAFTDDNVISPIFGASFDINNHIRLNLAYGTFYQFLQFYRIFLSTENIHLIASKAIHYIDR